MSGAKRDSVPVGRILPTIYSYLYIYIWVKRANFRYRLEKLAILGLAIFLVLTTVEVILELFGRGVAQHPEPWTKILFFGVVAILLYTKFREFGERRQQASFIDTAREVTHLLSRRQDGVASDQLIQKLLALFQLTFERKGWKYLGWRKKQVRVNAALRQADDHLHITLEHPGNQGSHGEPFRIGEGGAGVCFENECLVYIPRKALRHALVQDIDDEPGDEPFKMRPGAFVPQGNRDYQSILCVPIRAHGRCFGVLNFDSPRRNAFRRIDFEQATFYGFALALVLLHRGHAAAAQGSRRPPPSRRKKISPSGTEPPTEGTR